ncbi:hypothetical protein SOV_38710 [Sporomusa ovata DSM 2662]|uniref:Uncharacterized protein n=1 Tax=Sporomusa ovata TaxID=2378 RepID=A0A0U1KSU5_9FIRM|nr:hypothetical protein [Sporomusa ovata]EQB26259.1 hypothetical protein SOV_3c01330 [Sporomusa ovata DSM 2662]CQR70335.1 hypothetical protein SpAn4DRAFT_1304 [Sporomusa ovata]
MANPTLFVRERTDVERGSKQPRFAFIASVNTDLRVKAQYLRTKELEQIAQHIGGEVVYMKTDKHDDEREIEIAKE